MNEKRSYRTPAKSTAAALAPEMRDANASEKSGKLRCVLSKLGEICSS